MTPHFPPSDSPSDLSIPIPGVSSLPEEVLREAMAQGIDPRIMQQYAVYVCSIHPRRFSSGPHPHGGKRKMYILPAADAEKGWSVIAIYPTFERIMNTERSQEEIDYSGHGYINQPIPARMIAEARVREWAGDHIANQSGGHIGVGIIKGPEPTIEELKELHSARRLWAGFLIAWADAAWSDPQKRPKTKFDEARLALEYMGVVDHEAHPWFPKMEKVNFAPVLCPACGAKPLATAFRCPQCKENLAEYYVDREIPVPDGWPALATEVKYLQKKAARAAQASQPAKIAVAVPRGAEAIKS